MIPGLEGIGWQVPAALGAGALFGLALFLLVVSTVSYTHLTLPTKRIV